MAKNKQQPAEPKTINVFNQHVVDTLIKYPVYLRIEAPGSNHGRAIYQARFAIDFRIRVEINDRNCISHIQFDRWKWTMFYHDFEIGYLNKRFEFITRKKFEAETGINLDQLIDMGIRTDAPEDLDYKNAEQLTPQK